MAYNDSPDNEFDQEMERLLHEHFDAEDSTLLAPDDPWEWLESRMEEPSTPSFFSRLLGFMNPKREGRLPPAFAVAGVAVVAVAIAATVWAISVGSGPETPGGLAAVQATEVPENLPLATVSLAATSEPRSVEVTRIVEKEMAAQEHTPAATMAPAVLTAAPEATEAPAAMMEEEPTPYPAPAATIAPAAATAAPAALTAPTPAAYTTPAPQAASVKREVAAEESGSMIGPPCGRPDGSMCDVSTDAQAHNGGSEQPTDTTFRDYQRKPFVAASEDNRSTFSLDTDRTSYQLALNWARSGYEVNPDSVRAEEWLNAFDYQYDPPSDNISFAITSDLYPHPLDKSMRLARIAFQAPELVDGRPLNVTLVLDASGSMGDGNRVNIARQAAESIRQSLREEDRIAVVHFTEDVIDQYTVEHSPPDNYRIRDSISWLQPHGSTNVQAGLNLGVRLAHKVRGERPDTYNYVILMSDGVANVDATNPFGILETAYDPETQSPLRLITIGVGINNYNDLLLEQLAQHGNGWYRYLDSTEQAKATFARENWLALSTPFADQTRAQVTWDPEVVQRWRIIGYENRVTPDHTFTQNRKEFAELYSGSATTVFYELELHEDARDAASAELGRVELRWVEPDTGQSRSQSATLTGSPHGDFERRYGSLAHFGAIVALSADLYGILPSQTEAVHSQVQAGLSSLLEQLRSLSEDLGSLEAYRDFHFLLEYMADHVAERVPPSTRSGYSR